MSTYLEMDVLLVRHIPEAHLVSLSGRSFPAKNLTPFGIAPPEDEPDAAYAYHLDADTKEHHTNSKLIGRSLARQEEEWT